MLLTGQLQSAANVRYFRSNREDNALVLSKTLVSIFGVFGL
jgi:hypothetical protein